MQKPKILQISTSAKNSVKGKISRLDILVNQVTDSAIVGGIAGISAYVSAGSDASLKVFVIAFGLTFLIKLKEYRGIQ